MSETDIPITARDAEFLANACDNPAPPNAALLKARERFNAREHANGCCGAGGSLLDPIHEPVSAQQRFNTLYISSVEIAERMGVSRPAVLAARTRGMLPDPVCVNDGQIYIWERAAIAPYLDAWEVSLRIRRGQPVTFALPSMKLLDSSDPNAFAGAA